MNSPRNTNYLKSIGFLPQSASQEDLRHIFTKSPEACLLYCHTEDETSPRPNSSFLCLEAKEEFNPECFQQIPRNKNLFGYLSYEFGANADSALAPILSGHKKRFCNFPDSYFATYKHNYTLCSHKDKSFIPAQPPEPTTTVKWVDSSLSRQEYFEGFNSIKGYILAGDVFQVNLTRKFFGEFNDTPNPLNIFNRLHAINPVKYAGLLKLDNDKFIISFSPELYLQIDHNKHVLSSPIKGTSAPGQEDFLLKSGKDQAENLMILDLVRNDIGKVSKVGSVKATPRPRLEKYKAVNHLVSDVTGDVRNHLSHIDAIAACFPPGSMTGAPKIKATEIIDKVERKWKRGVYSGCFGRVSQDGSAVLSVVIRTLLIDGKKFEFQVGGGIVHESIADLEYEETLIKARPILNALGLSSHQLFAGCN